MCVYVCVYTLVNSAVVNSAHHHCSALYTHVQSKLYIYQ